MSGPNLVTFPHPVLTRRTKNISFAEPQPDDFVLFERYSETDVAGMKETLARTPNGLALAANQVGLRQRLFVLKPEWAKWALLPEVIVNPTWSSMNDETTMDSEGCLSFPGLTLPIERYANLDCSFDTSDGIHHHAILSGFVARVFQHECEHLDGQTFLENLPRIRRFQLMAEFKKRKVGG